MKIKISKIDWDTDGEEVKDLPKTVTIKDLYGIVDLDEYLGDWLSETYGFCHSGFEYEVVGDRQERLLDAKNREIKRLINSMTAYQKIANFLSEHKDCFADEQQEEIDQLFDAL